MLTPLDIEPDVPVVPAAGLLNVFFKAGVSGPFLRRGYDLKLRALKHILNGMWSKAASLPTGKGLGPKEIAEICGFRCKSEFSRQYTRGLLLELEEFGQVEAVPMGERKHLYRLKVEKEEMVGVWEPDDDPKRLLDIQMEGGLILIEAKKLVVDVMIWLQRFTHREEHRANDVEKFSGLSESRENRTHAGYWGWLIVEELINDGILVRLPDDGKYRMVKLAT